MSAPRTLLAVFLLVGLARLAAGGEPSATAHPAWDKITWDLRYDKAEVADMPLQLESLAPEDMAVPAEVDASFQPANGAEVKLDGGQKFGAYVFNNWPELQKLLSASVPGITFPLPDPYPNRSRAQCFALTPEQQTALAGKKGTLTLKITCDVYQLRQLAKFDLSAPAPVTNGTQTFEVGPLGDTAWIEVWRHGAGDPTDKMVTRSLVFLLVDPVQHTGQILEGDARGTDAMKRDPQKMDLSYAMSLVPDATPLDHKILYAFDPVLRKTEDVTESDPDFEMKWPRPGPSK